LLMRNSFAADADAKIASPELLIFRST